MLLLLLCLQHLVGCMAKVLDSRDSTSPEVAAAGMVINTMGYIDGLGYELLADAIMQLRVRMSAACAAVGINQSGGLYADVTALTETRHLNTNFL